jgi:hypothetical protein
VISSPDRPGDTGDQDLADGGLPAVGNGHGQHHSFERMPEPSEKSVRLAIVAGTVFTALGCVISVIAIVMR